MYSLFDQLSERAMTVIEYYRKDLVVHDANWLRRNPGTPFVHIARKCGTHIFGFDPQWLRENKRQKYLFGESVPRAIVNGELACMHDIYIDNPSAVWQAYTPADGLREVNYNRAQQLYGEWIDAATTR